MDCFFSVLKITGNSSTIMCFLITPRVDYIRDFRTSIENISETDFCGIIRSIFNSSMIFSGKYLEWVFKNLFI